MKSKIQGRHWFSIFLALLLTFNSLSAVWISSAEAAEVTEAAAAEAEEDIDASVGGGDDQGNQLDPSFKSKAESGELEAYGGEKAPETNAPAEDEQVNIIVELSGEPLLSRFTPKTIQMQTQAVQSGQSVLENEHQSAKQRIQTILGGALGSAGLQSKAAVQSPEVLYEYYTVFNGFSLSVEYQYVEGIEQLDGVKNVWIANTYEQIDPVTESSPLLAGSSSMTGTTAAYELGFTGTGMTVAVIDSGLDWKHEAFSTMPPTLTLNHSRQKVSDLLDSTVLSAGSVALDNVYMNDKVPFAYDYADRDTNVIPSGSTDNSHGTHVAGIVAASGGKIKGVAPDAQLMIMKVFDDVNGYSTDSGILAALDDSVKLGADVINMSLGSSGGFSEAGEASKDAMYERIGEAGVQLVVAAGNSYSSAYQNQSSYSLPFADEPDNAIVAAPSTYQAALSVASMTNGQLTEVPYLLAGERKIPFNDSSSSADPKLQALNGTYEYVYAGFGSEAELEQAGNLTGKIALISRGEGITFDTKLMNAYAAGAAAVVVFNNESGSVDMAISNYYIPAVLITQEDGEYLRDLDSKELSANEEFLMTTANPEGNLMSGFSSWGPAPDLKLKPEITAPGDPVYSAVPGNGYESMSGTSMASPQVAGASALIKQYVEDELGIVSVAETSKLIQALMMSTADPIKDEEGEYYSPRKQGAGMVDLQGALETGAYLTVEGNDRPKAELGDNADGNYSFTFTIHSLSDETQTYSLDTAALSEKMLITSEGVSLFAQQSLDYADNGIQVQYDGLESGSVSVPARGQASVTVSLSLSDELKQQFDNDAPNGTYIDGYVLLAGDSEEELSLPFLGFYGDWAEPDLFDNEAYSDEGYSTQGSYPYNLHTGEGYWLGQNHVALALGEEWGVMPDKFVISPKGIIKVARVLGTSTALLRNAENLTYTIKDQESNIVKQTSYSYIPKSYYYYGQFIWAEAFMSKLPSFDGLDQNNNEVPEGTYTFELSGTAAGTDGGATDTWTFDFDYDKTGPEVLDSRVYEEEDHKYLELTIGDNHYVSGLQLTTGNGSALSSLVAVRDADAILPDGTSSSTVTLDITDLRETLDTNNLPTDKIYVDLYDYAMNYSEGEIVLESVDAERVTLDQENVTMTVGTTQKLTATIEPENVTDANVVWTSSDASVAQVDTSGTVTGVSAGTTEITVATANGKTASSTVNVIPVGEEGIVLDRSELELAVGAEQRIKATVNDDYAGEAIEWESSDATVATVDQAGLVKALKPGDAIISASVAGKSASAVVAVVEHVDTDFTVENGVLVKYNGAGGHVIIPDTVSEIGDWVFAFREDIFSVKLGAGVRKIGEYAFYYNTELTLFTMSDQLEEIKAHAFDNASKLTEITLPDSVQTIGEYAFARAYGLSSVRLPDGLTRIENGVFYEDRVLAAIDIPASVTEIGAEAFYLTQSLSEVVLPEALQQIGQSAFAISALQAVTIPDQVTEISDMAFVGAPLRTLKLGEGLTSIGVQAFAESQLTDVVIPDNVLKIGRQAFAETGTLKTVTIGKGVTEIGDQAFHTTATSSLRTIEVVPGNTVFSSKDGVLFNTEQTTLLRYPAGHERDSYQIPDGVAFINDYAFQSAFNLKEIGFPDTLTAIGSNAFDSVTALTSLVLPDSVKTVGRSAFIHAVNLQSIDLGNGVEEISSYAFAYNAKLTDINLGSVQTIGSYAFQYCSSLVEISFPDNVVSVGDFVLSNNEKLSVVNIGTGLTALGSNPFASSLYIRAVNVAEDNASLSSVDGVLFDKAKTNLILYPAAKADASYTVPNGVQHISNYAFQAAVFLKSVQLPEGLLTIGTSAFNRCEQLSAIDLPDSLQSLGVFSFSSTGIEHIVIGSNLTQIPDWAFSFSDQLKSAVILGDTTSIGSFAFTYSPNLTTAVIGKATTSFGYAAFDSGVTIYGWTDSAAQSYAASNGFPFEEYVPLQVHSLFEPSDAYAGDTVTLSVYTSGGIGDKQYQFSMLEDSTGTLNVVQDYSSNPDYIWTPLEAGIYTFDISVKDNTGVAATETTTITVNSETDNGGGDTDDGDTDGGDGDTDGGDGDTDGGDGDTDDGDGDTDGGDGDTDDGDGDTDGGDGDTDDGDGDTDDGDGDTDGGDGDTDDGDGDTDGGDGDTDGGTVLEPAAPVYGGQSSSSSQPAIEGQVQEQEPEEEQDIQIKDGSGQVLQNIAGEISAELAKVLLPADVLAAIFDQSGTDNIQLEIPGQAKAYEITLPAAYITAGDGLKRIVIKTAIGSVEISDSMIKQSAGTAQNITLTLTQADSALLGSELQAQIGNRPLLQMDVKIDGVSAAWSNYAAPVTIAIPYEPTGYELQNPEHIGILHIDDQGRTEIVSSARYDSTTGTITFAAAHFSSFAVVFVEKTFSDLGDFAWAAEQVEMLASKGIINGTSQDSFDPGANVTRAEFITMLVRTLGLWAEASGQFTDVKEGSYYYEAIGIAKELNIAIGSGDNEFRPDEQISRQDMMVLAARALSQLNKLAPNEGTSAIASFTDFGEIAEYAIDSVEALIEQGLVQGADGLVNPRANTTRAEAAVILYRIYNM